MSWEHVCAQCEAEHELVRSADRRKQNMKMEVDFVIALTCPSGEDSAG